MNQYEVIAFDNLVEFFTYAKENNTDCYLVIENDGTCVRLSGKDSYKFRISGRYTWTSVLYQLFTFCGLGGAYHLT